VGTKADLRHSTEYTDTVTSTTDCLLAGRNLGLNYKEVSCHQQDAIDDTFTTLIDLILEERKKMALQDSNNNDLSLSITINRPAPVKQSFCRNLC